MKKVVPLFAVMLLCFLIFFSLQQPIAYAADLDDGTYSVAYTVKQPDNDSVSIANDYFLKPAVLTVNDGIHYIQFTIKQSEWVKSLKVASGDTFIDVVEIDKDTDHNSRVVAFQAEDLSQPIMMQMHITIESMTPIYDHRYTVRYDFDLSSIEEVDPPAIGPDVLFAQEQSDNQSKIPLFITVGVILIVLIVFGTRFAFISKNKK